MDIQNLRIFAAVAEAGSITEGARLLFMAQSNASRAITNLEREIGIPLFIRSREGVNLTREGAELLIKVKQLLSLSEEIRSFGKEQANVSGLLSIGAMESTAVVYLADRMSRFLSEYPEVRIRLVTADSDKQLEKLKSGEIDFAIPAEVSDSPHFLSFPMYEETLYMAGIPERNQDEVKTILVLQPGCSFRRRAENYVKENQIERIRYHEMNGIHTLYASVLAGMGESLFPFSFLEYHKAEERGLRLKRLNSKLTFHATYRSGDEKRPIIKAWIEFLRMNRDL